MIPLAFLAFVAVTALADLIGPGHQWGGLVLGTFWFFFCRKLSLDGWRWLLNAALALSVAIAALAVAQMWWLPRATGPFASPNFLGAYAVLMFFACQQEGGGSEARKPGYTAPGLYAAANLLSLALSQSRGALLALGAGLFVLLIPSRPKRAILLSSIIVLGVISIRPGIDEQRWMIWRMGWNAALQRPLTGWGQGGLVIGGLDRFYSIPLEVFIASGVLGLATGCVLIAAAVRVAKGQPAIHAFLAAWFVQGLFLFSIPATNVILVTVLAYLASYEAGRREAETVHHHEIT